MRRLDFDLKLDIGNEASYFKLKYCLNMHFFPREASYDQELCFHNFAIYCARLDMLQQYSKFQEDISLVFFPKHTLVKKRTG